MLSLKKSFFNLSAITLLLISPITNACNMPAHSNAKVTLSESYQIEIPNLDVALDNGKYTVTVDAKWYFKSNPSQSDYIDSNLIVTDIKNFLTNYPSKTDFWEMINHKLSLFLINKYKQFALIKIKIKVPASVFDPYQHGSVVVAKR